MVIRQCILCLHRYLLHRYKNSKFNFNSLMNLVSGELTFVNIFVFLKLFPLLCVLALVTIGTGVGSARSSLTAAMDG